MRFNKKSVTDCYAPLDETMREGFGFLGSYPQTFAGGTANQFAVKGEWVTLVLTYDGKGSRFYVNGELTDSNANVAEGFGANDNDLYIGRMNNLDYPFWFKGAIDEIRIYNRALSAKEVWFLQRRTN